MNNDLISRSALKNKFDDYIKANPNISGIFELGKIIIDNAPTMPLPDFKEGYKQAIIDGKTNFSRPQGEWYYNYQNGWHCSICNRTVKDMPTVMGKADFNFCPNCGADMRGGAEND